ncbi:hypothetical protein [Brevibacillus porteri]|uniref:Uncharacterized protein n=1 Tax=Brevibacillus porteri TaxID=2126350 RepID=A0ABX5FQF1_9BACL|nr:hypothetical protein [Brevibacillus porteri]MED1800650.1 hypothetical protein [Brevibacillus porteri]MED2134722.1 hypothetical protein [Brevibacillus porteri]MED2745621.1 hypothetical protein [Brevibacillus porteri]MED2814741.1 hypothetical protein [Brevibacillus porteri]MED2896315.1 hypothetical protein [Brevibacillus porteri]
MGEAKRIAELDLSLCQASGEIDLPDKLIDAAKAFRAREALPHWIHRAVEAEEKLERVKGKLQAIASLVSRSSSQARIAMDALKEMQ